VSGVPGLAINGASGVLSGTPATAGNLTLAVTLADAHHLASSIFASYSITITATGLTITTSSLPGGIQNRAYSASLAGSGGSGTYNWAIGGISGLTVNAGTGAIGGSPTVGGSLALTVTLSDAVNPGATPAMRQYAVTITFAPLTITTSSYLGKFAPNAPISRTFAATGGSSPFAWSASGIPATLTVNPATGQITGNAPANPGDYSFLLRITDTETPVAGDSTMITFSVLGITPARYPKR
jgi:large repetitive protein